jgi:hypothetical protein
MQRTLFGIFSMMNTAADAHAFLMMEPNPPCSRPRWRGIELGASLDAWWRSMRVPTYHACQRGG